MYGNKNTPSSYVDDISIRHRYRLSESTKVRHSSTKWCPGTSMLPERNHGKFTDLYPSGYDNRLGQNCSLGRCNSTLGNTSYSRSHAFHSTKPNIPQHGHLTRSQTMPYYQEESQVSHKKGWSISQMSKWHVTLMSGWSSTHMIGSYFNLFTDGPLKYFDSMVSTHTFKLDVTCPTISEDETCDDTCYEACNKVCDRTRNKRQCRNKTISPAKVPSKDHFRRHNAASRITHHTRQVDSCDLIVSLSSSASKSHVDPNKSRENTVERRFKEIAEGFVQEVSAKGSEILELVSLTFNANNQIPILGKYHNEPVKSSNVDGPSKKEEKERHMQASVSSKTHEYINKLTESSNAYSKDVVAVSPLIVSVSPPAYNSDIITALDSKQPLDVTFNANVKDTDFYCSRFEATPLTYNSQPLTYDKPHLTNDKSLLLDHNPSLTYETPVLALYGKPKPTYETPGLTYNSPNRTYYTPCLKYNKPAAQAYDTQSEYMVSNGNIFESENTKSVNIRTTKDNTTENCKRYMHENRNRQLNESSYNTSSMSKDVHGQNLHYTSAAMITSSYLTESAMHTEIPGEGHRPTKYHSSSTWKDAISTAWREGMSSSWRHTPLGSHNEAPSTSWRRSLVSIEPDKEVTNTGYSGKSYTLRDEVSLRLSAVYSMGVRVTRAIIGRHTEVQPTSRNN